MMRVRRKTESSVVQNVGRGVAGMLVILVSADRGGLAESQFNHPRAFL